MPHIVKNNDWSNYLRYPVELPREDIDRLLDNSFNIFTGNHRLHYEVEEWCEENIGYTDQSDWHKDPWHPKKPKWELEVRVNYSNYRQHVTGRVKFFDIEDAIAFKLRWF